MNLLVLVVDDEPDVEVLFRQQFRHDLRAGRFTMDFAQSTPLALSKFDFVVNLRVARALGLTPSPEFLSTADEVIE